MGWEVVGYTAKCGTVQQFGVLPTAARSAAEAVRRAFWRGAISLTYLEG